MWTALGWVPFKWVVAFIFKLRSIHNNVVVEKP